MSPRIYGASPTCHNGRLLRAKCLSGYMRHASREVAGALLATRDMRKIRLRGANACQGRSCVTRAVEARLNQVEQAGRQAKLQRQ